MRLRYALSAVVAIVLAGCGTTEEVSGTDAATEPAEPTAGAVTMTDARGVEVSLERPAEKVVALEWSEAEDLVTLGDDVFADGLADNAIWQSLPFVENGNVHKLEDGTWTFGGPLSSMVIVDQFVAALTA